MAEEIRDEYKTNGVDKGSAVKYIGQENNTGSWIIQKIDLANNNISYATVKNNDDIISYDIAWANRATLTYENYSTAF